MFAGPISEQPTTAGTPPTPGALPNVANPDTAPVLAQNTSGGAVATLQGINPALATTISKAIALGLVQAPTNDAGWAKLMDQYSTPAGSDAVTLKMQEEQNASGQQPAAGAPQQPTQTPGGLNAFLAAIRQHESGGNYKADSGDGAYGAYQFIPSTWNSEATAAGYGQYANGRADLAPAQVQDAVASHMASGYASQFNNDYNMMARAWFDPAYVNNPNFAPPGNNGLTIGAYGQDIVNLMGQNSHYNDTSATTGVVSSNIVKIAQGQLGVPYVWGGESANKAFDCSGLVQWVYGQAGETLPRVAQGQYDATPKVATGAQLQAGDLLFFGSGPKGIEHVGIYIGNGQMIDAPHTGADVRVDTVFGPNGQPLWGNYVGATRPADPTGVTTAPQGTKVAANISNTMQNYGAILSDVISHMSKISRAEKAQLLAATTQEKPI